MAMWRRLHKISFKKSERRDGKTKKAGRVRVENVKTEGAELREIGPDSNLGWR